MDTKTSTFKFPSRPHFKPSFPKESLTKKLPSKSTMFTIWNIILFLMLIAIIVLFVILFVHPISSSIPTIPSLQNQINKIDITDLNAEITKIQNNVATLLTNEGTDANNITSLQSLEDTDASNITALQTKELNDITNALQQINTATSAITALQASVTTNTGNITTLQTANNSNSTNITALQQQYTTLNTGLTNLTNSLASLSPTVTTNTTNITSLQTSIANVLNMIGTIPSASTLGITNLTIASGWNGPFYINLPNNTVPKNSSGTYFANNGNLDLSFTGPCLDVSQTTTSAPTNPTSGIIGGLYGCNIGNKNQQYYLNNNTGQLYNTQLGQCLTVGNVSKPSGAWTGCNSKDPLQKFNLINNRLQYIDSSALDVSMNTTNFNTSLMPSSNPNFKNQYLNFIYTN
jgi:hypothetical protein